MKGKLVGVHIIMMGNSIEDDDDDSFTKPLGRRSVIYYGMGHMLNDITAACWFTYLLLFLTDIGLSPRDAAMVMLSGQVADGFTTILAGELIDRFGHFKIWHAAGSVLVAVSFSSIANLSLYAVALIVFAVTKANTYADFENQYRWIVYSSIFIGCCSVGIFLFGTKEPRSRVGAQGNFHVRIAWAYWIKRVPYYEVAIVYVLTRLVVNVSQEIAWTGQCLKAYYSVGGIIWIFSGAAIVFLPRSMSAFMYIISIFIGVANALMMMMMMIRSLSPLEDSPSFIMAWVTCSMISLLPVGSLTSYLMLSGQIADGFTAIFAGEL
ncbi:major facilitator superfamily domain-containing protein 12, partial [Quercus suber]